MTRRCTLPSGTVTFLFTDVERSTQVAASIGDQRYADLLEIHQQLLREAFAAHHGIEIRTEGDAFFVAFACASDAVAAAIEGQRALDDASALRVRMGLHTGEALVRNDDYIGYNVNRAKRIEDAGHGGQTLMSQATAELVRSTVAVRDLGTHALKDLVEPERIYQVLADGLDADFPPLRTLESRQNPSRSASCRQRLQTRAAGDGSPATSVRVRNIVPPAAESSVLSAVTT